MGQDYCNQSEAGREKFRENKTLLCLNRFTLKFAIDSLERKEWKITKRYLYKEGEV